MASPTCLEIRNEGFLTLLFKAYTNLSVFSLYISALLPDILSFYPTSSGNLPRLFLIVQAVAKARNYRFFVNIGQISHEKDLQSVPGASNERWIHCCADRQ